VKTRSLIVLNKTVMPAMLVECLFADSDDATVYDAEVIARVIVSGLVGADSSGEGYGNMVGTEMRLDGGIALIQ
jgi:N-acetylmuramoyl-L-alanine amidase